MPPAAKRDCGIILFDMNASNKEEALAAIIKICTFNWLSCNKNTYRLILSNTKESQNVKNYSNLYDTGVSETDPQFILHKIENTEAQEGDWLNALLLAIHHLKEAVDLRGIITLQILYITTLDGCLQNMDMSKVEQIVNDLNEYGIYLYIIGPNVKLPYTITNNLDVSAAMEEATVEENKPTLDVAKRIIDTTTNSVMCDLKVGINLFFSFRNSHGLQPWKVPLSFGSVLEIPVCTVKIYKKGMPFVIRANRPKLKYVLREDESISVQYAEITSGVERHGKFVRADEREMFKVDGPRSFAVIGFTGSHNIAEYFMREETFYVLPDEDKPEDCCQALYNLVDVLADEKKYAIVRRVYSTNNKPKFFILVPQPDLEPKCFVMSALPYADDLNEKFKYSDSVKHEGTADEAFEQFFDSIDIWSDKCKLSTPLGPKMMLDPYSLKLANEAGKKYLERDFPFEELDMNDLEAKETNEFLETLKASWTTSNQPGNEEDV